MLLRPAYKDYLWGGDRLKKEYNKETDIFPLAESWECSVHPAGESVITNGVLAGKTLASVLEENPDFTGTHPDSSFGFPILIKFIDANSKLSVQVHPDDEYAYAKENGEHGKTEMWYVLDSAPGSELIYGFSHDTNANKVRESIEKGNIEKYLNKVKVQKDDVFFVTPGTVHAIGSGILVAEIQESSNLTYRLYDYDRKDSKGNKRELHIDKALEVTSFKKSLAPRQPLRVLRYKNGYASEFLCRCKYFEVHRILINTTESDESKVFFEADELSFRVLLCVEGSGCIKGSSSINESSSIKDSSSMESDFQAFDYRKGDCIFIPASTALSLSGKATFLDVRA